jgi:hypothetical protein
VLTAALAAATVMSLGGAALASIPDTAGTFHGCYSTTTGVLRLIDPANSQHCHSGEKAVSWDQAGITWKGKWDPAASYKAHDAVAYVGSSYLALTASTGQIPPNDPSAWAVLAQAGNPGAAGAPGAPGAPGPPGPPGPSFTFSTVTGQAGPALTTGTYFVVVKAPISNNGGAAISGFCSVDGTNVGRAGVGGAFVLNPFDSSVFSFTGMIQVTPVNSPEQLILDCFDDLGSPAFIDAPNVTWWYSTIG